MPKQIGVARFHGTHLVTLRALVVATLVLPATASAQVLSDAQAQDTDAASERSIAAQPMSDAPQPMSDSAQPGSDASAYRARRHKAKTRHKKPKTGVTEQASHRHKAQSHRHKAKSHHRKAKSHHRKVRYPRWALALSAETSSGVMHNQRTLQDDALFAEALVKATPRVDINRPWRLSMPTEARYRHTWLTPLREAAGAIGMEAAYAPIRPWEFEADAGVDGVYRPDWPDQYQVAANGSLESTDRFSYWARHVGASTRWGSFKSLRLELGYEFSLIDYLDDPAYDPSEEPTHLVPGDRLEHSAQLDIHRRWGFVSVKPGFGATYKHYFNAYARDAGTGLTHASIGGEPENPVLRLWTLEPELRVEVEAVEDVLTISTGYTHAINIDIFDGYYSYHAPKPSLSIKLVPLPALTLKLGGSAQFWRYGKDSYAEGGSHPALEEGSRRRERLLQLDFDASYDLSRHWAVFVSSKWRRKDSNMPDYVPGIYPSSRQYSIDWDYTNLSASSGVRFTL